VVNEGTGAANETVGVNTILMAPGITKMLAKAAVRTRFERSMKETAENLAKDKDVAGAELLCTMCMKLGTAFCNGCQRARYCSAECQRAGKSSQFPLPFAHMYAWLIHNRLASPQEALQGLQKHSVRGVPPQPDPPSGHLFLLRDEQNRSHLGRLLRVRKGPDGGARQPRPR